jgi:cation diffusion facilitator CzcD-associated flavoprotein CzcO
MTSLPASTDLLIIGAGPYGLATAAYASQLGVDFILAGRPMSFWREHMPAGMLLRSPLDWQIDPLERRTIFAFLNERSLDPALNDPLPLDLFVEYGEWFRRSYEIEPAESWIDELQKTAGGFRARSRSGDVIDARHVLIAPGFADFAHIPAELASLIPAGRYSHTCDTVDFSPLRGRRCLIIGGRQSAYEWAALMAEAGVAEIHVSHRHKQPRFELSDWSWVQPMVEATASERGWFRHRTEQEREEIRQRFWKEGRLKLEPWLAPRLDRPEIHFWPETELTAVQPEASSSLQIGLNCGDAFTVDHVLFATGYRVDMGNVGVLAHPSVSRTLRTANGFPMLDEDFQSSVEGLFIAGLPATQDFGPFFGFVSGAALASRMIVDRIAGHR